MPITKQNHIIEVKISAMPKTLFDPLPVVEVRLAGEEDYQVLFSYYPDEISFSNYPDEAGFKVGKSLGPDEIIFNKDIFLGLTLNEARYIKFAKDKLYLTT